MRQRSFAVSTRTSIGVSSGKVESQYLVGSRSSSGHSISSHSSGCAAVSLPSRVNRSGARRSDFLSAGRHGHRMGDDPVLRTRPPIEAPTDDDPDDRSGAVAVASATNLILDFSDPCSGLFRPSQAPIQDVLKVLP